MKYKLRFSAKILTRFRGVHRPNRNFGSGNCSDSPAWCNRPQRVVFPNAGYGFDHESSSDISLRGRQRPRRFIEMYFVIGIISQNQRRARAVTARGRWWQQ
jgi:hypothetical protein